MSDPKDPKDDSTEAKIKELQGALGKDGVELLLSFFSGKMLGNLSMEHKSAVEAIHNLKAALHNDGTSPKDFSLASGLTKLGDSLENLNSPATRHYGHGIKEVAHELMLTYEVLHTLGETLEQAEANKDNRDPIKRKELAGKLRKVPAGIDYVVGQMSDVYDEYQRLQTGFRAEVEHREMLYNGNLPEGEKEEHEALSGKLQDIEKVFSRSVAELNHFRSVHIQLKNYAVAREKEFMKPPATETQRTAG